LFINEEEKMKNYGLQKKPPTKYFRNKWPNFSH